MDESRVNNFQRRQLTSHMLREYRLRTTAGKDARHLKGVNRYRRDSGRRPRNRRHLCTNDLKSLDLRDSLAALHKSPVYVHTATSSILVRTASLIIIRSRSVRRSVEFTRSNRISCIRDSFGTGERSSGASDGLRHRSE